MKQSRLIKIYAWILLIILGGIVIHAPFSVGLGTIFPDNNLLIKSWKEILLIVAAIICLIIIYRNHMMRQLARDWTIRLSGLYSLIHILLIAFQPQGLLSTLSGLAIDLRYIVFFVLVYVLILVAPGYRIIMIRVAAIGAVIVLGFGILQLFLPTDILAYIGYGRDTIAPYLTVDRNPDYIRINSTLRGPNPLGAYALFIISLLAAAIVRARPWLQRHIVRAGMVTTACLTVLWISYSRSALIGTAIALGIIAIIAVRHRIHIRTWVISSVIICASIGGIIAARETSFVSNVILHENQTGGSAVSSNDGHLESLIMGAERLIQQPLGAGIGSTGSASLFGDKPVIIENQYLLIAHESGWIGLGLFIALYLLILRRLWQRRLDWLALGVGASGVGLMVVGLLLPVWVDDTVAIIWWGFAAIALGRRR